ncbi:MAG: hypothetical protein QN178_11815 [Armatimonadota bacterium]|nr:hypothetical protein [Armatimonadota bacterium]
MDPTQLIGPSTALGYPAPYWFMTILKVLGFTLHLVPMNLWFAGILVALLLRQNRNEHARRFSTRLMSQMPIIIALGINFGIVPLLFAQVAYYRVFYPATILMAWPWLAVVFLLIFAYYGVYGYAVGLRDGRMTPERSTAGWMAAVLFIAIGFVFSNAFTLMTNLAAWPALWQRHSIAGAATGTALNLADPTLWPRWLMVFGLALTTTAAYAVVDAGLFARREPDAYRRWVRGFAMRLYAVGAAWFAAVGSWYVFGTWGAEVRQVMFGGLTALTAITTVAPALPWLSILAQRDGVTPGRAAATGLLQVVVLALNATSRQVVQNAELRRFVDVTSSRLDVQWSPLVLFLLLFVAGLVLVGWMVAQALEASRHPVAVAHKR